MPAVARDARGELAVLRSLWEEVRRELLRAKHAIDEEIRGYPTPIPRCDAQFNHLHEQRARLARELDRIGAVGHGDLERRDCFRLIGEYIASAPYTDDFAERDFRSRLGVELSAIRD